jgi:hypothetical protein
MKKVILLFAACIVLTACETSIQDERITEKTLVYPAYSDTSKYEDAKSVYN